MSLVATILCSCIGTTQILVILLAASLAYIFYQKNIQEEEQQSRSLANFRDHKTWDISPYDGQTDAPANDSADSGLEEDVNFIPYKMETRNSLDMISVSESFFRQMNARRSCRFFSKRPVPLEVLENVIKTAGTSPSGAHCQPWTFAVVGDSATKAKIREIIEEEEEVNYKRRMGEKWVNDLRPFKTNWMKPYLEIAPYLVIVFKQTYGIKSNGEKKDHYYNDQSVCIAVGLFLAALQNAGLATVTTTPLNAGPSLRTVLGRPKNEKVILLLPIGYPADDATVPDIKRKPLEDIMILYD